MKCAKCEQELRATQKPFEYTQLAGLSPMEYTVLLEGIRVFECACGRAPEIPNVEGLQFVIGAELITRPIPLRPSAIRFLRKTAGLTQEGFAKLVSITPEHLSTLENGRSDLKKEREALVRFVFLDQMLQHDGCSENFDKNRLVEVIRSAVNIAEELAQYEKDEISISNPPHWASTHADEVCNH